MLAKSSKLRNSTDGTFVAQSDGVHPSLITPEQDFFGFDSNESILIDRAINKLSRDYTWLETSEGSDLIVNIRGNYPYILTKVNGLWFMSSKAIRDDIHPELVLNYFEKALAL